VLAVIFNGCAGWIFLKSTTKEKNDSQTE
jgi:hypothetical protein